MKGLKSSVQHDVASVSPHTFDDAVRRTFWFEVENENCVKASKQDVIQPTISTKDAQSKRQRMKQEHVFNIRKCSVVIFVETTTKLKCVIVVEELVFDVVN